jgi:hypothetical protein
MTEVKNGPTQWGTHLRMDAVAIKKSWANPCITAYEVKVSRNDFVRDDKWPGYLNYCNKLAFACPKGLIQVDELPPEVGLVWVSEDGKLKIKRHPVFRVVEIPAEFFQYIIMCKIQSDRYPFFGEKETYFKEYLENKREIKSLGHKLNHRVANKISDMERDLTKFEAQSEDFVKAMKQQNEIERLLRNRGVSWNAWRGETCLNALEKFLDQGKKGIDQRLQRITVCAEEVLSYLKGMEGSK